MNKYTIYEGKFPCKTCHEEVKTIRFYKDTGSASWMCTKKHISKASIIKTKKDYEREKREQENRG